MNSHTKKKVLIVYVLVVESFVLYLFLALCTVFLPSWRLFLLVHGYWLFKIIKLIPKDWNI